MLETIGISKILTEKEVSEKLSLIFPKLIFQNTNYDTIHKVVLKSNEILFFIHKTESDFPIRIEILFQIQNDTEEREQFIANKLSKILECKTIVGYQEKNDTNPYLNLVFENGKIFLADDMETKYAEDGKSSIKIINEINYKLDFDFNGFGIKIENKTAPNNA